MKNAKKSTASKVVEVDGWSLSIEQVMEVARHNYRVVLAERARENIRKGQAAVEEVIREGRVVYGVTTGFGAFCDKIVSPAEVKKLQRNLIISHAIGVGEPFGEEVVRAIMLLRINTLASGYCGIRLRTVELLVDMLIFNTPS